MQHSAASAASNSLDCEHGCRCRPKIPIFFSIQTVQSSLPQASLFSFFFFFSFHLTYLNTRLELWRARKENTDETDSLELSFLFHERRVLPNNRVSVVSRLRIFRRQLARHVCVGARRCLNAHFGKGPLVEKLKHNQKKKKKKWRTRTPDLASQNFHPEAEKSGAFPAMVRRTS